MKTKSVRAKYEVREKLTCNAFLLASFSGVLLFYILPFCVVMYYSVTSADIANHSFVGLDNFKTVINNNAFRLAAKNTLSFSLTAVPLAVILALGLALLLEAKIPGKSMMRTFFLSPMMVPIASIVLIWQVVFDLNGTLNQLLMQLGFDKIDWFKSDYGQFPIVLMFLWKNLGYNMILFMAALNNMPRELIEEAQVDGASRLYCFFKIKIRYLSPTLLFVTILSLINSFKIFREVFLLTGEYPFESLYMLQHYMNNMFIGLDYQKLSAAAVIMAGAMVLIIAILFICESIFGKDVEG